MMPRTKEPGMVKIAVSLSRDLLEALDRYAAEHLEDRSTALRQLLDFALKQKRLARLAEQYRQGLLTLREVAEALGLSYRKTEALLGSLGVPVLSGVETYPEELEALARKLSLPGRKSPLDSGKSED